MTESEPRYLDAGEAALVVEFSDSIDAAVSDRVLALDRGLSQAAVSGIIECVPTFRSLMIHYDPLVLDRGDLVARVRAADLGADTIPSAGQLWSMPICYDPPHGEDLGQVAAALNLAVDAIIRLHAGATFRLYMYGFAPGFAYLGGLPPALAIPRRASPRPPHPENAIIMAGGMSVITTFPMPTGWYVIGRTPERMFSANRDPSFLMAVGDEIRFAPVDAATFAQLEARAAAGEPIARKVDRS